MIKKKGWGQAETLLLLSPRGIFAPFGHFTGLFGLTFISVARVVGFCWVFWPPDLFLYWFLSLEGKCWEEMWLVSIFWAKACWGFYLPAKETGCHYRSNNLQGQVCTMGQFSEVKRSFSWAGYVSDWGILLLVITLCPGQPTVLWRSVCPLRIYSVFTFCHA